MKTEYLGLDDISGSLAVINGIDGASYDEIVDITLENDERRTGRIIEVTKDFSVILIFESAKNISLTNTRTKLTGKPFALPLSKEILGRTFDGIGRPLDGLGPVFAECERDINGSPINPVSREYPNSFIQTGISSIDCLMTLIRGQKLPIFSGNGMPHDKLAVQIATQAKIKNAENDNFAIVFAAMGVKHDVADFFTSAFKKNGAADRSVMFIKHLL